MILEKLNSENLQMAQTNYKTNNNTRNAILTMNAPGLWREMAADDNLKKHAVQILPAHTSFSPASFHTLHGQFLRTLAAKGDKYVTALNSK